MKTHDAVFPQCSDKHHKIMDFSSVVAVGVQVLLLVEVLLLQLGGVCHPVLLDQKRKDPTHGQWPIKALLLPQMAVVALAV